MSDGNDTTNPPLKRCSKCGEEFPATPEYFQRHSHRKDGLYSWCKLCTKVKMQSRKNHAEYNRQWRLKHPDYHQQWRESNPDYHSLYFKKNQVRISKRTRIASVIWRRNNQEWVRKYSQDYYKRNPLITRINGQRRKARKATLTATFTAEQWQTCLEYFHHTCAYCGDQQDFWHVLEQEHFVPLTSGGGYTASNIIPACKSCNSSKQNKPARDWIRARFKRKSNAILSRINSYFEWLQSQ